MGDEKPLCGYCEEEEESDNPNLSGWCDGCWDANFELMEWPDDGS